MWLLVYCIFLEKANKSSVKTFVFHIIQTSCVCATNSRTIRYILHVTDSHKPMLLQCSLLSELPCCHMCIGIMMNMNGHHLNGFFLSWLAQRYLLSSYTQRVSLPGPARCSSNFNLIPSCFVCIPTYPHSFLTSVDEPFHEFLLHHVSVSTKWRTYRDVIHKPISFLEKCFDWFKL